MNLNGDTLTLGNVDNSTGTFSGTLSDGLGFNSTLIVNGGSQQLTGSNTYSGSTTVSGGTLRIGGLEQPRRYVVVDRPQRR